MMNMWDKITKGRAGIRCDIISVVEKFGMILEGTKKR